MKRLNRIQVFGLGWVLSLPCVAQADSFSDQRDVVRELGKLTEPPSMMEAKGFEPRDGMRPILFDALDYEGKLTKVFAWLGIPANSSGKVPGIVLVHGGGGTAFPEWVSKWIGHGFAAISIAVEGQTDQTDPAFKDQHNPRGWKRHDWRGPRRDGIYGDTEAALKNQWMYHAVADTVLANSLLRSLPEVDAENVGVMGISWGGVITSTVMGLDSRFAFAIPTYGCGNLAEAGNQYGRALGENEVYKQVWNPMLYLKKAGMPALWLSWPGDQHFPLDKQAASYEAMKGEAMVALIPEMRHGHGAGWNPPDSYAFAKSVVEEGRPWCLQVKTRRKGRVVEAVFDSTRLLDSATLISTTDTGITGSREWVESAAILEKRGDKWTVTSALQKGSTSWFVNVRSGPLTASSKYVEISP
ncbi:MAG: acetylxylan esterase [Opitutaceae bacterium]|nr:acetylxylan esterase [Opitutaceae bacterium]